MLIQSSFFITFSFTYQKLSSLVLFTDKKPSYIDCIDVNYIVYLYLIYSFLHFKFWNIKNEKFKK